MNFLSGNKLKLIALVSMTLDHIGKFFFPTLVIFQMIGRVAFPIFAYMIAEGWKYTGNRIKYLSTIWIMGILYQVVFYIFYSSLYMGIFITYGLSLLFIFAIEYFVRKKKFSCFVTPFIIAVVIFIGCIEYIWPLSGFAVDYGLLGIFIPVVVYFSKNKLEKLCLLFILLCVYVFTSDLINIFSLLSIVLLSLYNGKRGFKKLKYFFYIYYPFHLVVIWLIGVVI